jgi:hypothetical protein
MDLSTLANVATALAVLTAVAFGLLEAHRSRKQRAERAAFAAVQAILTPEWMKSMIVVQSIADGSTASEIEGDARVFAAVQAVGCILEGLGYLYMRGLFLCASSETYSVAPFVWPGVKCSATSKKNIAAAVPRKRLNGSNGSPRNWNDIHQERPTWRWAPTELIRIGSRSSCVPYRDRRTLTNVF